MDVLPYETEVWQPVPDNCEWKPVYDEMDCEDRERNGRREEMNKHQEALDRMYDNYVYGAKQKEDSYFTLQELVDKLPHHEKLEAKAKPMKPNKDRECNVCGTISEQYLSFYSKRYAESFNWQYCANCGQALDWSEDGAT